MDGWMDGWMLWHQRTWLTAMTSVLSTTSRKQACTVSLVSRMLAEKISGDAITAHTEKCALYSSSVMPGL